ncbi:hypothetical protein Vretifemale_19964, partial [Volvox reticuliferus]
MARTDASPERSTDGTPAPTDSTLRAIERAIEQAGPRDPAKLRMLCEAKELFFVDPAGAQRLLDDILHAEVLLGIGRGFVGGLEGRQAPQHSGREVSADLGGRTSSGRTVSNINSAGGVTDDAAVGPYHGIA